MRESKSKKSIHAFLSLSLYFLLNNSVKHTALGLYADEVGLNDFTIATTGHGSVKSAWFASPEVVISSNSLPPESNFQRIHRRSNAGDFYTQRNSAHSGCYVAGRNASTGSLLWRHNVCASSATLDSLSLRHSVTVMPQSEDGKVTAAVLTLDDGGILQKWGATSGSLQWNVKTWQFATAPDTILTTTERLFLWKENEAVLAVSYRFVGDGSIRKEGLTIHSIHNGHPMYYSSGSSHDDISRQPLIIFAEDLLSGENIRMHVSKSSANEKTHPRIISVRAVNNHQLYIVAGYVPESSTTALTSQIGIFQVEVNDKDQYVVTKSISFKDAMMSSRNGATHVDVSLFRFAALEGPIHYGVIVTVPPPNAAPTEGKYHHFVTIPITPSVSKGSAQFLEWNAESRISDLAVQNSDNLITVTTVSTKKSRTVVKIQPDGRPRVVNSPIQDHEASAAVFVTSAASMTRCGVSHSIFARVHIADQRHNREFYSMQVVNLVENDGELTKEEIFFQDIPIDILDPSKHGEITSIHAISCKPLGDAKSSTPSLKAFLSTSGATSIMIQLSGHTSASDAKSTVMWTAEESLARIQATTFVDAHPIIIAPVKASTTENANTTIAPEVDDDIVPSVTERWYQQWQALLSLIPGSSSMGKDETMQSRDVSFGFAKRAVVLTANPSRLFGLDVQRKGKVAWSVMLTNDSFSSTTLSTMHSLVHSGKHGQHHANEILTVTQIQETVHVENQTPALLVEWNCIDGVDGTKLRSGTMELDGSKKIVQITPIRISTGAHTYGLASLECRQQALLLLHDGSVEMVPPSKVGHESLMAYLHNHKFYMHSIDWQKGELRSLNLQVSLDNTTVSSSLVGKTVFPFDQEKIVSVTYPSPEEVIQSPVTILGDDALLLKYLNPHLAVIVTEATSEYLEELQSMKDSSVKSPLMSAFLSAGDLSKGSNPEKSKKKPLGVTSTKAGENDSAAEPLSSLTLSTQIPSLFINLVDTVSGKLLHRTSYSHSSGSVDGISPSLFSRNFPVVISENWVLCTFWNHRSQRTEVLVLTLHDGMIDKHGITAFKRPQQDTKFSSFESPKPIVLHRTFALSTEVTALGVTQTSRGISMKHFLFALGAGQVVTVDRRFLDPRRPSGEPKPAEKTEGLLRYHPILPLFPLNTVSYNRLVEGVSEVKSVAAQVESQSMVLAYGGPDVFFVRIAPSKGFDLLPDNFSKGLLLMIVVALVGVVVVMQRMSNKEILKVTWL